MNLQYTKKNFKIFDCEKFSDLMFSTPKDLYILENIYIFLAVCTQNKSGVKELGSNST